MTTTKEPTQPCDNHPDREGKKFTGGGAYEIHLCEECAVPWLTPED